MIQNETFNQEIAAAYEQEQPYSDESHPPIFLSFSAIPGSGKTTLAKKLYHDLRTQYVNHDDLRDIIRKRGVDPEELFMPPISTIIVRKMFKSDKNKFVILDAGLDRRWDIFFERAEEMGARPIVIRLQPPMTTIRERLRQRDGDNGPLLDQLDRLQGEFENCRQHVKADITLGKNYDYNEVIDRLKELIFEQQS